MQKHKQIYTQISSIDIRRLCLTVIEPCMRIAIDTTATVNISGLISRRRMPHAYISKTTTMIMEVCKLITYIQGRTCHNIIFNIKNSMRNAQKFCINAKEVIEAEYAEQEIRQQRASIPYIDCLSLLQEHIHISGSITEIENTERLCNLIHDALIGHTDNIIQILPSRHKKHIAKFMHAKHILERFSRVDINDQHLKTLFTEAVSVQMPPTLNARFIDKLREACLLYRIEIDLVQILEADSERTKTRLEYLELKQLYKSIHISPKQILGGYNSFCEQFLKLSDRKQVALNISLLEHKQKKYELLYAKHLQQLIQSLHWETDLYNFSKLELIDETLEDINIQLQSENAAISKCSSQLYTLYHINCLQHIRYTLNTAIIGSREATIKIDSLKTCVLTLLSGASSDMKKSKFVSLLGTKGIQKELKALYDRTQTLNYHIQRMRSTYLEQIHKILCRHELNKQNDPIPDIKEWEKQILACPIPWELVVRIYDEITSYNIAYHSRPLDKAGTVPLLGN